MSLGSESKSESGKSLDVSESIADIGDPDVNESDEGDINYHSVSSS